MKTEFEKILENYLKQIAETEPLPEVEKKKQVAELTEEFLKRLEEE